MLFSRHFFLKYTQPIFYGVVKRVQFNLMRDLHRGYVPPACPNGLTPQQEHMWTGESVESIRRGREIMAQEAGYRNSSAPKQVLRTKVLRHHPERPAAVKANGGLRGSSATKGRL